MKIISRGSLPENDIYKGTCSHCKTVIECARHEGEFVTAMNQRDDNYLKVRCPVCTKNINAYKRNDGALIPRQNRDYTWDNMARFMDAGTVER